MRTLSIASAAATALAGAAFFATVVKADLDPIIIKGQHFFYKTNGSEFFIRGVAYQQDVNSNGTTSGDATFVDPLADGTACSRDIPLLQELGTNVIRVYAINASLDHSSCMKQLQNAGIYVIQDLSNPSASINRNSPTWNTDLFHSYAAVVDAMAPYSNVLGFFAGNEVSNQVNNTAASAFVKAAVRDMKAYIKTMGYRTIGVGYATNDDKDIRQNMADYFNCGDSAQAIDFWGYNIYSWCGDSSYTLSGYDQRVAEFSTYSVPAFFAEYGCNNPEPRQFTEVQAIYGSNMTGVFSGGIVYMYFQEVNNYGLVQVGSDGSATKLPDFTALSSQLAKATPSSTSLTAYTPANTAAQSCPTVGASWSASSSLPPIANPDTCTCMINSLSCIAKNGLTGNRTAEIFDYICGADKNACIGINANATTGNYGAYSMCNAYQKLSFVINAYYNDNKKAASACDFNGDAKTVSASAGSNCSSVLSAAGTAGTGSVTAVPTGSGSGSGTGIGTGTGSSSSSSQSTTKSAAGATTIPQFDIGLLQLGVYVVTATLVGAGMVLL